MAGETIRVLVTLTDPERADEIAARLEEEGFALADGVAAPDADVVVGDGGETGGAPQVLLGSASSDGSAPVMARLPARADPELVAAAVRLAAAGYRIEPAAQGDGSDAIENHAAHGARNLTSREQQVLALLAVGAPNKVIARELDISVHTAKFHVAGVIAKLGARNRTDAIAIAMRDGLVMV